MTLSGTAKPTKYGKLLIAHAFYEKGGNFLQASVLLQKHGGNMFVVEHLFCQGLELIFKGLLLFRDYDKYKRQLKKIGHDLKELVNVALAAFGLNGLDPKSAKELETMSNFYGSHLLRYGSSVDVLMAPPSLGRALQRKIMASLRLAKKLVRKELAAFS